MHFLTDNYTDFGYPFVVHDADPLRTLATDDLVDLVEFTDVFQVKPEPDEPEMQLMLPDEIGATEKEDIQVNNLSSAPSSTSELNPVGIKKGKRIFKCVPCNKVLPGRHSLYSHNEKYHKADLWRSCEFCGRILANSITYRRHKQVSCKEKDKVLKKMGR